MGFEAYLTPVGPKQLGVAMLWREGVELPKGNERLWRWLDRFEGLRGRFDGVEPASVGGGSVAWRSRRADRPLRMAVLLAMRSHFLMGSAVRV